jgi:hypothetical protein
LPTHHPQRVQRAIQDATEKMENRAANGGIVDFGFIQKAIDKYNHNGYTFVNRNALDYRRRLHKLGFSMNPTGNRKKKAKVIKGIALEEVPPVVLPVPEEIVNDNDSTVSPITESDEMIVASSPGTDVSSNDQGSEHSTKTSGSCHVSRGQKKIAKTKVIPKHSNTKNKKKRVRIRKVKADAEKNSLQPKYHKHLPKLQLS